MIKKHITLEQLDVHTGLTKAEGVLLSTNSIESFCDVSLVDLMHKGVVWESNEQFSVTDEFFDFVKKEKDESAILIYFAKKNIVIYLYEIPLLKLLLAPTSKEALYEKTGSVQKVFYQALDERLLGYDVESTKAYFLKNL